MGRIEEYPLSQRQEQEGNQEERFGLLQENKDGESDDLSFLEEEDGFDVKLNNKPVRKRPWLHILAISFLMACVLGILIAFFILPRRGKDGTSQPSQKAQLRLEEDYILDPKWNFDTAPTTREYHWTIAEHDFNPDGVYRPMMLINGMFPGPLIECNEGDEIVVHVSNRATNATSFHWHGLYQNGTNWMDGTVGVTQCPIAPGTDFTYRFKVADQSGTYWYHSHMSVQASDGLVGPFIIHTRNEKELQKMPYSKDVVVMVSDHYYDLSSKLLVKYLEPDRENSEPVPPSAVMNGRNTRNCTELPNRHCETIGRENALFDLSMDSNTRLRFINVGAFTEFQIQIDEHEMHVSEVDGTDVLPQSIHRLNINPAQRYSVIVVPPAQENKGLYWLRARMITHCFAEENLELKEEVRGIIKYSAPSNSTIPNSLDWPEIIELECRDLNTSALVPVLPMRAPDKADDTLRLRSSFQIRDWQLSRGYLNDSSTRLSATSPSLSRILNAYTSSNETLTNSLTTSTPGMNSIAFNPQSEPIYQTPLNRTIDILIQNLDDGNHPFHLHGYKFFVLAQGHGYPPENLLSTLDLANPLRRDTASVEAFGWTLIRFVADNPGVWVLHCHISWHSEAGLLMQILVGAEQMRGWNMPGEVEELCGREGVERGAGPDDKQWVGSGLENV
jgi:FtsP/CotA-like multicopper oxidase with cupredoxin domain